MSMKIVILAGGVGTRFWPISTPQSPKQFLPLFSSQPMIVETLQRVLPIVEPKNVYLASSRQNRDLLRDHLPQIPDSNLLLEPCSRNTAPALGMVCLKALSDDPEAVVVSLHSDHLIRYESRFLQTLKAACEFARNGDVLTLGICPQSPHTGYGYIRMGQAVPEMEYSGIQGHEVLEFKEKPDSETAADYLRTGEYFWNAGMFIFRADAMLKMYQKLAPGQYEGLMRLRETMHDRDSDAFAKAFEKMPSEAFDTAILEKCSNVRVIPCDIGWSDVGSYQSIKELSDTDANGNSAIGVDYLQTHQARHNLVIQQGNNQRVSLLGVENLMVVQTENELLVGRLQDSQMVKNVIPDSDKQV